LRNFFFQLIGWNAFCRWIVFFLRIPVFLFVFILVVFVVVQRLGRNAERRYAVSDAGIGAPDLHFDGYFEQQ